ncbi:MAG: luciferase family protein [bacterium]
MNEIMQELLETVRDWESLTVDHSHHGDITLTVGRRQVGHFHDQAIHVPFPRSVRDSVIESGEADPHPYNPDSGWVEVPLEEEADLKRGRAIIEKATRLAQSANEKKTNE